MFNGYENLIDDFKRLIENNGLSHAYLFFGGNETNHQEKFVFAQSLANFLENGIFKEPLQLLQETLIIPGVVGGVVGIDSIRILKYFLWQKPTNSPRRVAIIKGAENLTPEAQNAALKIVEEPPESALIIFITNSEDSLFPTLNSRLQKIYFPSSLAKQTRNTVASGNLCETDAKLSEAEIDQFFENLIIDFKKDPIKNSWRLKEMLKRLTLIKQFNTNKRLQLRALISNISEY